MKIVITGGAGFIGSHLVERLLADGYEVAVLDNFSAGREKNLAAVQANPKLTIHKVNVADFDVVESIVGGTDWVFHLAALSNLVPSIEKPREYLESNVVGTMSILEASRKAEAKRFIYTASSSCYGIPDSYPTSETAPVKTEYPYSEAKYLGERLTMHYAKVYKFPAVSLRLFNVYGPRVRTDSAYGAALGVFLAQKMNNKPLTIVGDGHQTRDFVFVTDVVDAFVRAAASDRRGEIFNVGSGNPQSVNTMVRLVGGKDVVYVPKRPGEPDQTHADISKITSMLGWQPKISFEEGIKIVLEHADDWKEAPVWTPEKIEEATKAWFKYLGTDK